MLFCHFGKTRTKLKLKLKLMLKHYTAEIHGSKIQPSSKIVTAQKRKAINKFSSLVHVAATCHLSKI